MDRVFADTFYWIALLNPRDQAHERAVSVSRGLGAVAIITTDEVLIEFLNYFGTRGPYLRRAAMGLTKRMESDRMMRIVSQTHEGFLAGCCLYQARPDKAYSLTDCISMEVMRREGLSEVLTKDDHFRQEGFSCLLGD